MLPKSHRITKKQFMDVYQKKVFYTPFFGYKFLIDSNYMYTGFSIVVPKSVSKKAVTRNSIKRQYYNYLKENKVFFENSTYRCIVIVSKKTLTASKDDISKSVVQLLQNIEYLCLKG